MTITKNLENEALTVAVAGRIDSVTAPDLEAELADLEGINLLIIDYSELEYTSSAGLRVLLAAHNKMNASGGTMIVRNVPDVIMKVFDITGFSAMLNIE